MKCGQQETVRVQLFANGLCLLKQNASARRQSGGAAYGAQTISCTFSRHVSLLPQRLLSDPNLWSSMNWKLTQGEFYAVLSLSWLIQSQVMVAVSRISFSMTSFPATLSSSSWWDLEALLGQRRNTVSPSCSGSMLGFLPSWVCLEHL